MVRQVRFGWMYCRTKGVYKRFVLLVPMLVVSILGAAPVEQLDPVSEFYPDWRGITQAGFISGREICPSDLRHKVTIVVEVEANEKLKDQLLLASRVVMCSSASGLNAFAADWAVLEVPRDVIAVVSVHGAKKHAVVTDVLSAKGLSRVDSERLNCTIHRQGTSVYEDVTFTGAPDNGGKFPFVYIMGPDAGKEPIFKGELTKENAKTVIAVILKAKRQLAGREQKWRPFYGSIAAPKYNTSLAKTLVKGRTQKKCPLDGVLQGLSADILSSDVEKSKEAQILFDAVNQTRSELLLRIRFETTACPYRAYRDIQTVQKYWPNAAKAEIATASVKVKAFPLAEMMGKILGKLMDYEDPSFVCKSTSETKAVVSELKKMKKQLAAHKESQDIKIQNAALLLDSKIDSLMEIVPSKVAPK